MGKIQSTTDEGEQLLGLASNLRLQNSPLPKHPASGDNIIHTNNGIQ